MLFTQSELSILNVSINTQTSGQSRKAKDMAELKLMGDIMLKLKALSVEKEGTLMLPSEGELELSTMESAFVLQCLKEPSMWTAWQAVDVMALQEKLA